MAKPRTRTGTAKDPWVRDLETDARQFATKHGFAYSFKDRELSAAFEIGSFLALVSDYERQGLAATPINLVENEFRYLTSPTGNPSNFSHIDLVHPNGTVWTLRQQIRVISPLHQDIYFTPDIVVLDAGVGAQGRLDPDYAKGEKKFFSVPAASVVSLHECKSLVGFPELYVSFLGMVLSAHPNRHLPSKDSPRRGGEGHLVSTLFVGGTASNLHRRMISALEDKYVLNIVTGVHRGGWVVARNAKKALRLQIPPIPAKPKRRRRTPIPPYPPAATKPLRPFPDSEVPF